PSPLVTPCPPLLWLTPLRGLCSILTTSYSVSTSFPNPLGEIEQGALGHPCQVAAAALIGATVGRLRSSHLALLFQQQAEVECGCSIATLVGATVGREGVAEVALLLEQNAQV